MSAFFVADRAKLFHSIADSVSWFFRFFSHNLSPFNPDRSCEANSRLIRQY